MDTLNIIVDKYESGEMSKEDVIRGLYRLFAGRECSDEDVTRELTIWPYGVPIKAYVFWFLLSLSEVFG